jgi:hypothetical protein
LSVVAVLVLLSVWKWDSTVGHLTSKLWAIPHIINQPLGYGLGTSGPAIHHNWTLLPENYYFQIMLDIGTVGFLLRALVMFQIIWMHYHIKQSMNSKVGTRQALSDNATLQAQYLLLQKTQIWFLALLVIGLVLHIFEDSMVNYLFFIWYGILLWSLSHLAPKKISFFIPWNLSSPRKAP